MIRSKAYFSWLFNEVNPRELCRAIKYLFIRAIEELKSLNCTQLNNDVITALLQLQLDHVELFYKMLIFSEKALLAIEYLVVHLRLSNTCDVDMLCQMAQTMDPNELIVLCDQVHKTIILLDQAIVSEPEYKVTELKCYLRSISNCVLSAETVILICIMPWALPLEAHNVTKGLLVYDGTISSFTRLFRNLVTIQFQKDVTNLSNELQEAQTYVDNLAFKLSTYWIDRKQMSFRIEHDEVETLIDLCKIVLQDIEELGSLRV